MTYSFSYPSLKIVIVLWGSCSVVTCVGTKTSIRPTVPLASVTLKCYDQWLLVPDGVLPLERVLSCRLDSCTPSYRAQMCSGRSFMFKNAWCFKNTNNTDTNNDTINDIINNDSDGSHTDKRLVLYLFKSHKIF